MHLKISFYKDTIFEWIPYNKFNNIKEISKGDYATVHSAIWKNGPLYYNKKAVVLKCIYNSQNMNEFLNEVCDFFTKLIQF